MRYSVLVVAVALGSACGSGAARVSARPEVTVRSEDRVSASFASRALDRVASPSPAYRRRLLDDPGFEAVVRHARLTSTVEDEDALLDRMLGKVDEPGVARRVLAAATSRPNDLLRAAAESGRWLPDGARFEGTIHLVVGYDIAVASPPDVVINVAHPHFRDAPREVLYYATHEAHHVGFLKVRPLPSLEGLNDPEHLRAIIRFMTQMEGMAVHAAHEPRQRAGDLDGDPDYQVYGDAEEAARVIERFRVAYSRTASEERLSDATVGGVLNAMSSGERLWYRFGALVAAELARRAGRRALVSSIRSPERFWTVAEELMGDAGPGQR